MYDKVKLWIGSEIVGAQLPTIADRLEEANTLTNHQTGEMKTFGSLNGLKVSVFAGGVSIVGSLPKYLYGSNVYPLDRHTTAQAVEKLSDALHVQADKADATGLEFGTCFLMRCNVTYYLLKLGDMPRLSRYHFDPSTLYYKGKGKRHPKVFAFYDKLADARAKGMKYPEELNGANLLKYEMRFNGRLPQQLRVPEVKASTLSDVAFYRKMVKLYQDNYFSISKINQMKTNVMSGIETVTDAFNVLVARLLSQTDPTQIAGFLDELKEAKVFDDRKYYQRLKDKIREVATKANITESDELVRELDNEIRNCGAYV